MDRSEYLRLSASERRAYDEGRKRGRVGSPLDFGSYRYYGRPYSREAYQQGQRDGRQAGREGRR